MKINHMEDIKECQQDSSNKEYLTLLMMMSDTWDTIFLTMSGKFISMKTLPLLMMSRLIQMNYSIN